MPARASFEGRARIAFMSLLISIRLLITHRIAACQVFALPRSGIIAGESRRGHTEGPYARQLRRLRKRKESRRHSQGGHSPPLRKTRPLRMGRAARPGAGGA